MDCPPFPSWVTTLLFFAAAALNLLAVWLYRGAIRRHREAQGFLERARSLYATVRERERFANRDGQR